MRSIEWGLSKERLAALLTMLTLDSCAERGPPETIAAAANARLDSLDAAKRHNSW